MKQNYSLVPNKDLCERLINNEKGNQKMTDMNDDLGTIVKERGYYKATLKRVIEHDIENVWEILTNPDRFVDWLAPGKIELAEGGAAKLNFEDSGIVIDSIVSKCKEYSVLEYSWSSGDEPLRPVCWQLDEVNGSTQLTLVLGVPVDEDVARSCAGWEAHLMMLLAAIEGVPIKFPFERFVSTREAYNQIIS